MATVTLIVFFGGCAAPAYAACELAGQKLRTAVLDGYEKNPASLLASYQQGGYGLEVAVAQLSVRGPHAVSQIFLAAMDAKPKQKLAVGEGLRRVFDFCQGRDRDVVRAIGDGIAKAGVRDVNRAFNLADIDDLAPPAPTAASAQTAPIAGAPVAQAPDSMLPGGGDHSPQKTEELATKLTPPGLTDPFAPLSDPFGPPADWR